MSFSDMVERLRAVQQRIRDKGYPMPTNIYLPNRWETDSLDQVKTENALREYEDYEKLYDSISR